MEFLVGPFLEQVILNAPHLSATRFVAFFGTIHSCQSMGQSIKIFQRMKMAHMKCRGTRHFVDEVTYANANLSELSRSSIRSFESSIPTLSLSSVGGIPLATRCSSVMVACDMRGG